MEGSTPAKESVFGFILFGTPMTGALALWVSVANELHARGFRVHVWWAFDRMPGSGLHPDIPEHWLFHAARYAPYHIPHTVRHGFGRMVSAVFTRPFRERFFLRHAFLIRRLMRGMIRRICNGAEGDTHLARRFAREMRRAGVTHVLPMLADLSPWAFAAADRMAAPPAVLAMFQGYEVVANYARPAGLEAPFYARLRECVARSPWPAVAVSEDNRRRIIAEVGLAESQISVIPNGIRPLDAPPHGEAARRVAAAFPAYRPGVPLVTFLGRRDPEKGVDLLLYAAALVRGRGRDLQLAVCGSTIHGLFYGEACRQVAENLRLDVMWGEFVPDDLRAALFAASDVVVYPSIHGEAFGLVPVEAMSCGTPVIVPDSGGVSQVIRSDGIVGGLTFRELDSGDLADQIERVLSDEALRRNLRDAAPRVAATHSLETMTDRLLAHMDLPARPSR